MLTFIPIAGLALGVFAARTFGRTWPLILWLSVISAIFGVHTWFWRDVYFPSIFGTKNAAAETPWLDIFAHLLNGPVLLGIATAGCIGFGLLIGTPKLGFLARIKSA